LQVDGTLVDCRDAHARSWAEALRARGVTVPLERIRPLIGLSPGQLLPKLTGIPLGSPLGQRVDEARVLLFRLEHVPALRPFPRVRDLLERMHAEGLRLGGVSSTGRADMERLIEIAQAADLLEASVSIEEAPELEVIDVALERLQVDREATVLVTDTPYDLGAAARSGVPAIALRCGGWDDRSLSESMAIYQDPSDLLERFDRSPLADGSGRATEIRRA
jgi:phosphoglycolate phosphatase-like HAD superfamily hydrolase